MWGQFMQYQGMFPGMPHPGGPMGTPQLQQIGGPPQQPPSASGAGSGTGAQTPSTRAPSSSATPDTNATSLPGPHNAPWSASASTSSIASPPPPGSSQQSSGGALKLGGLASSTPAPSATTPSPAPPTASGPGLPATPKPAASSFTPGGGAAGGQPRFNPNAIEFNFDKLRDFKPAERVSKAIQIKKPPALGSSPTPNKPVAAAPAPAPAVIAPVPTKPSEATPMPAVVEPQSTVEPAKAPTPKPIEIKVPTPATAPAPAVVDEAEQRKLDEAKRAAAEAAIFSGFYGKPVEEPAAAPAPRAPTPTPPAPEPVPKEEKEETVAAPKKVEIVEPTPEPTPAPVEPAKDEARPVVPPVGPAARDEPIPEPVPEPEPVAPVDEAKPVVETPTEESKPAPAAESTAPSSRAPSPAPSSAAPSGPPPSHAIREAKPIEDLREIQYPSSLQSPRSELNPGQAKGKFRYDRDFLMQFLAICHARPEQLPSLEALGMDESDKAFIPGGHGIGPATPRGTSFPAGIGGGPPGVRRPSAGPGGALGRQPSMGAGMPRSGSGHFAAMGSFAPPAMGGAKTSAERFAASTAGGAGAFGRPAGGIARTPSQSQAHALAMARNERPRSNRGSRRGDPRGGASMPTPLSSIPSNVAPLEQSANAWGAQINATKLDADSPQMVDRKVKALLNKLTVENFDSISNQILDWANKSEKETDGRILRQVIRLVFEKATDEAAWSEMYASLCRKLQERLSPDVRDLALAESSNTPALAGGTLFRKYLLTRCQEDYERGWAQRDILAAQAADKASDDEAKRKANEAAEEAAKASGGKPAADDDAGPALLSDEYYAAQKAKRRGLGLVRFIGELYKLEMLTARIMHECVRKLLSNVETPEEEDIESLCRLLTTVGKQLEASDKKPDGQATQQSRMDIYMVRLEQIKNNPKVNSRMRFMVEVPRCGATNRD